MRPRTFDTPARIRASTRRSSPWILLAALVFPGCATTAPKAPPALLHVQANTFAGTALSGPLVERTPDSIDWDRAWLLVAELAYVATAPTDGKPATGRIVVVEGAEAVFGARPRLAATVRVGASVAQETTRPTPARAPAPAPWRQRFVEALPAGTTVVLEASPRADLTDGAGVGWEIMGLEVVRAAAHPERIELALVLVGDVLPRPAEDPADLSLEEDPAPVQIDPLRVSERVLLHAAPEVDGEALRLVFPAPRRTTPHGGFVLELTLRTDPEGTLDADALAEARERGRQRVVAAHDAALERARGFDGGEGFRFEIERALLALKKRELQRPALIFLAQGTDATLTEELALVASPEDLGEYLGEVSRRGGGVDAVPGGARAFGWFLERCTWSWLATRAKDESHELAPELYALMVQRAGELGRYPDLLLETLGTCADADALAAALVDENRIFLEDAHPAARLRAFDWLARRATTPADYDPLGPKAERRAALAAAEAAGAALEEEDQ